MHTITLNIQPNIVLFACTLTICSYICSYNLCYILNLLDTVTNDLCQRVIYFTNFCDNFIPSYVVVFVVKMMQCVTNS